MTPTRAGLVELRREDAERIRDALRATAAEMIAADNIKSADGGPVFYRAQTREVAQLAQFLEYVLEGRDAGET